MARVPSLKWHPFRVVRVPRLREGKISRSKDLDSCPFDFAQGRLFAGMTASVRYRREYFYPGRFNDELEAAKARDRKAHGLYGEHTYLNFPEDFGR